jgi:arylsulfatase A-like enzyme
VRVPILVEVNRITRALLGCVAALPAACRDTAPEGPGPIVLLVSLDSVRRDFLSCYGYVPPLAPAERTTPSLDRLAAEGALFEDAYATTSWTLPSHHTLFSGLPEIVHGVELDSQRPAASLPSLTEWMREQGFRTAGFYSGPYLDPRFGFGRGFERYEARYGAELAQISARLADVVRTLSEMDADSRALGRLYEARVTAERALELASHRDVSSEHVSDAVIEELERAARDGEPLFLFAHYFDPHYDYVPPAGFAERFDPGYEGSLDGRDVFTSEEVAAFDASSPSGRRRVVSDRDLEHLLALYAAELAWTDAQIGRVLERLDELGLAERTLVVVVADHGDEFFEHGGLGHRRTLHEEVVRVPLIVRWPGHVPAGARIAGAVELADVAPTITALLGHGDFSPVHPARSLEPMLRGEPGGGPVLGRLVRFEPFEVRVRPTASAIVAGQKVIVTETWRMGSLEITREMAFPRPGIALDEATRAAFDEGTAELRSADLTWTDHARGSGASRDFADPAARAALREFHDAYVELARQRAESVASPTPAELVAQLRALGYTGSEDWQIGAGELVLPPPGAEILGAR